MKTISKLYDHERSDSWATSLRKQRFALFKSLIEETINSTDFLQERPLRILDVGGKPSIWHQSGFLSEFTNVEITLLNISPISVSDPRLKTVIGDARNMDFADHAFDVVFSNSVIEHVGNYDDQVRMAKEVMRVGKRFFIQTPNLYFPIEPHFVFPFFQFLPLSVKVLLINHFRLGWRGPVHDKQEAIKTVSEIRLLSKKEFTQLFPKANIFEEKIFGLTKSFIAYSAQNTTKY